MTYVDKALVLLTMIWFHIVDDYYIQGILAKMKQKIFWKDLPSKFKYDYKMALFEHAFSNTFMIHIPLFYCYIKGDVYIDIYRLIISFCTAIVFHYNVDDLKINGGYINLITDQIIHIINIVVVWIFYVFH